MLSPVFFSQKINRKNSSLAEGFSEIQMFYTDSRNVILKLTNGLKTKQAP